MKISISQIIRVGDMLILETHSDTCIMCGEDAAYFGVITYPEKDRVASYSLCSGCLSGVTHMDIITKLAGKSQN